MPSIDLGTTRTGIVTPAEFEQRKSKLRHLDGYSKGIVKGVRESLEAARSDPEAQERLGRETFSAELARLHLDPGSVDHDLALRFFNRRLSRVVEQVRRETNESKNGEIG